ncbi:MAG TPA: DCC1-like thiol-disulfide oxidoreductase family protein, partial [Flavobacteriales bacterium]|nr:DCC1-like thiol-disulfide oxidoreductase family protein [Flavobacteriales bacterium]
MGHATEKPVREGPAPAEHLLLFDGVCNLCNGLVQFIARRDRRNRFRFIPLQSD